MIKKSNLTKYVIGLILLSFLVLWLGWTYFTMPISKANLETDRFVIPKGQAISIITGRLEEEGFIRSSLAMRFYLKQQDLEKKLQAGSFEISTGMSVQEIATVLTTGTDDVWITIVEGWRAEEIADMLERQELSEFDKFEFLSLAKTKPGQLFPDSYLIPRLASAETIFTLLTNTFEKKIVLGLEDEIEASDLSLSEIITLASIVEREAKGYDQSRIVAGILLNRIEIGMPLQVDATLQYIKGYSKSQDSWWPAPLAADKSLDSGYNTYANAGLPPGPISNPGLDAFRAVLNPVKTNDLFYIHDNLGKIHTAADLDAHNANVQRYLR